MKNSAENIPNNVVNEGNEGKERKVPESFLKKLRSGSYAPNFKSGIREQNEIREKSDRKTWGRIQPDPIAENKEEEPKIHKTREDI